MQVLLQANIPNVGMIGEIVKVRDGFARNYLIPRGMALVADKKNKRAYEHHMRIIDLKKQQLLSAAQETAKQIGTLSVTIQKQVGEEDKIFGSVTAAEVAEQLKVAGVEIDRRVISILDDIKRVGVFRGAVKLHPEVTAEFKIWVVAKSAE